MEQLRCYSTCVQSYDLNVQMGVKTNSLVDETSEPVGLEDDVFLDLHCQGLLSADLLERKHRPERWNATIYLKALKDAGTVAG
ncbi:hypothetical protein HJFPF1_05882 [Paramyrothecium foliicola]|nr:hypothetical protein HJFPF1_05882 [Paramyrothecium foliicola]